ncbi:T9SS type A sorting domain-containing protein [candidate division KSB1 bacterium]|nr:T9SS type A sorting domain-containing protein [candidate division KSB1 bacterium]
MGRVKILTVGGLIALLALSAYAGERNISVPLAERLTGTPTQVRGDRNGLDEVIYYEDFEDGMADWTTVDNTAVPGTWHINDWNAFAGTSWWSGDSTVGPNGGYQNGWYMVLDSPPIVLPATPGLNFMHRYRVETPGGEPAGYNGWDGCNLRISINNGQTWTVVPSTALTPAYDRTSLYSFGEEHGEGLNIPGWCGSHPNWTLQQANLTTWAGQTVRLRWAFASDPGFATPDDPNLFGWQIDNIRVFQTGASDTVFSDDCNSATGWSSTSNVPTGGNLWRLDNDASSPSGPHVLVCNSQASSLYNDNMNDEAWSPIIDCTELENGQLIADFVVTGSIPECAAFPNCDYWGCQISTDSGFSWCYASNPLCDPNGQNFVYVDTPPTFTSFNASYSTPIDLSALVGNTLRIKFTFESNADGTRDIGPKFDSVTVVYNAGFPNDVSCYTLQVRYPNVQGRPTRIKAYFSNPGQEPQAQVQSWYRYGTAGATRLLPNLTLDPGATDSRQANITFPSASVFTVRAYSALGADENLDNDTSTVEGVTVQPSADIDWDLGYDNRTVQFRFNFPTGDGAITRFTPVADTVATTFSVREIRAQFDAGQPSDLPIRLHVYRDNAGAVGAEIYNELITVLTTETGTEVWKIVDVSADPDMANLNGNFWVWWEVTSTAVDRYPEMLGDDEQPWSDRHFYRYTGTGTPTQVEFFYQVHAVIRAVSAAGDEADVLVPAQWSLAQNYPNPFNPTTEITYSVPRSEPMTLTVYNVLGEQVATLFDGTATVGTHTISFEGANFASGVYVYRLETATFSAAHKMVLMK